MNIIYEIIYMMQGFVRFVLGLFSISELNRKDLWKAYEYENIYEMWSCEKGLAEHCSGPSSIFGISLFSLSKRPTWRLEFINQRRVSIASFLDASRYRTDIIFRHLVRVCLVLFIALRLL